MSGLLDTFMFNFLRKTLLWFLLLPYVVAYTGAASNQLVFFANNGKFPVRYNAMRMAKERARQNEEIAAMLNKAQESVDAGDELGAQVELAAADYLQKAYASGMLDERHSVMTDKTHLNLLGDIIDLHDEIDSVGDLLLDIGEATQVPATYMWLALVAVKLARRDGRD
jgi:hypothetical protein